MSTEPSQRKEANVAGVAYLKPPIRITSTCLDKGKEPCMYLDTLCHMLLCVPFGRLSGVTRSVRSSFPFPRPDSLFSDSCPQTHDSREAKQGYK